MDLGRESNMQYVLSTERNTETSFSIFLKIMTSLLK